MIQWPHEAMEDPVLFFSALASLRTASSLAPPLLLAKWLRHFQASQCTRGFFGLVCFGLVFQKSREDRSLGALAKEEATLSESLWSE